MVILKGALKRGPGHMQKEDSTEEENFLAICREIDRQLDEQSLAYMAVDTKLASLLGFLLLVLAGVAIGPDLLRSVSSGLTASLLFFTGLAAIFISLVSGAFFWHSSAFSIGPYLLDLVGQYATGTNVDLKAIAYEALFDSTRSNASALLRKNKGMSISLTAAMLGIVLIVLGTLTASW